METCCLPNSEYVPSATSATGFLPRVSGDLTIAYDVIQSYQSSYFAQVTIENHNPLGRLDQWRLTWEWARHEFIYSMKGAYPASVDASDCIFGPQGNYYKDAVDFSKVLSCNPRPIIIDLPPWRFNDTGIPHCCRNGTILPAAIDPEKSKSSFQLQVYKMPPDVNLSILFPPVNWNITATQLDPSYECTQSIRVSPAAFPNPSVLYADNRALASWQVVCNITRPEGAASRPMCCVTISAFYNDSVIPCRTCACGCPANNRRGPTCDADAPPMLLPPEALLLPFENRTAKALAWEGIKHVKIPNPVPCGDHSGVRIN